MPAYCLSPERSELLMNLVLPVTPGRRRARTSGYDYLQTKVCNFLKKHHKRATPPTLREIHAYLVREIGAEKTPSLSTLHGRMVAWQLDLLLERRN